MLHYQYIAYVNYIISLVVTITVTCYSWAPSSGDQFIYMWRHLQAATWLCTLINDYACETTILHSWMENTVIQHTFLKLDQSQKSPEPQIKQKTDPTKKHQRKHWYIGASVQGSDKFNSKNPQNSTKKYHVEVANKDERTVKFFNSSPIPIRKNWIRSSPACKIFKNYQSNPALIRPCKTIYFFVSSYKNTTGAILPLDKHDW